MTYTAKQTLISLLASVLIGSSALAQDGKKVVFTGAPFRSNDVVFLGELHLLRERDSLNTQLISFVHEQNAIANVVVEYGKAWAYLGNRYIQDDDSTLFFYKVKPALLAGLEKWRTMNKTLPRDKQITLYGIDFERMEFIKVLQSIFKRHPETKTTALFAFVSSIPDSMCSFNDLGRGHSKLRKSTYAAARRLFEEEQETLKPLLNADYEIVKDILMNPNTERHFALRDQYMSINLEQQLGNKEFFCIVGQHHTNLHRNRSLIRRYIRNQNATGRVSLITVLSRDSETPKSVVKNEEVQSLGYGKYYHPGYFTLVNQSAFATLKQTNAQAVTNYYAFFDYKIIP